MELQLIHAGIPDVRTLREVGAQEAWLRLRVNNASLSLSVLLALEGGDCRGTCRRAPDATASGASRMGGHPVAEKALLFGLGVDPLLQAADFRQQRQQQANLL